jgi:hypothetical protein
MSEQPCPHVAFLGGHLYPCHGHEDGQHHFSRAPVPDSCPACWCLLPAGHASLHAIPAGRAVLTMHGREPLYDAADGCGHDQPPEPDSDWSADDEAWQAFDAWTEDHQPGTSEDGELICLLSPDGFACPACSLVAMDQGNEEYVECEVTSHAGS